MWRFKRLRRPPVLFLASLSLLLGAHLIRLSFRKHRPAAKLGYVRSKLEQDAAALLRQQPTDPIAPHRNGQPRSLPPGLSFLRVSVVTGPLLITAPHGIPLWRQDFLKGAEPSTTKIAWRLCFMPALRGRSTALTWRDITHTSELSRTSQHRFRDPNYLLPEDTRSEPWSMMLRSHFRTHKKQAMLLDIHGMADTHDSDCTIGINPWNLTEPAAAISCESCLYAELRRLFPAFRIKHLPYFTGDWDDTRSLHFSSKHAGRLTLSKQAALLGMRAVQIEMSLPLRNHILGVSSDSTPPPGAWQWGKLLEFAEVINKCLLQGKVVSSSSSQGFSLRN